MKHHSLYCLFFSRVMRASGVLALAFTIVACATVPPAQDEERVGALLDRINERDADQMIDQSRLPFLFEDEVVEVSNDLYILWIATFDDGFSLPNASVESITRVGSEEYYDLRDSKELPEGYGRRLPESARIARIQAQQGTFELVL
ncbi:MAG: hypothetical protein ACOC0B_00935, partial [bacterium]